MNGEKTMRIIELRAENFMRLKAVRIMPDKTLVRIEGRNAAGKSAVLNLVAAMLGGGKWKQEDPIRRGERKATGTLAIGPPGGPPKYVITKRWIKGNEYLEVKSANGDRLASPQRMLAELYDDLTLDPLEFSRMSATEQAATLRRIAGINVVALDEERGKLYAERTVANRAANEAKARVGPMPPKPARDTPISVSELAARQQEAVAHNREVDDLERLTSQAIADAQAIEQQVAALKGRLAVAQKVASEGSKKIREMNRIDVADLGAEIAAAEQHNAAIVARRQYEERAADAKAKVQAAEALDDQIKAIDDEKERKLREAKFPLPGLGVSADGLPTLNDIPLSQASSSEQLRIGAAIALSGDRPLRLLLIREGSMLDEGGLADLDSICQEFNAQALVERVADTRSPGAVYIEDGEVIDEI